MIPEPITIDGRSGTVVYLDADWHPVPAEQAVAARVLFDDGGSAFFTTQEETQKREYVRDAKGKFAEVFHGTTEERLQSILKEGLTLAHAGEIWPGMSHKDSVYITTSEKDAVGWAEGTAQRLLREARDAGQHPDPSAVVVLTVQIPSEQEAKLTPDKNIEDDPKVAIAWQFKGPIPPEWIVGAKIRRIKDPDMDWRWQEPVWEDVPLRKAAADGKTIYVVLVLNEETVQKFDKNQLRDEKGRWATGGKAGALVTDTGRTFLHGTAQGFLDSILKNGIRGSEGGKIHPKDRQKRVLALPGHVYMTTDLEEAKEYAVSAGLSDEFFNKNKETVLDVEYMKGVPRTEGSVPFFEAGTEIGGGLPCVITIELPPSVVKKLRKDRRSDILTPDAYSPGGDKPLLSDYARSYKGDIKPEWIKSITYQTRDVATGKEEWHTIEAKDYKKPEPTNPPWLPAPKDWPTPEQWLKEHEEKEIRDAAGNLIKTAREGGVTVYIALKIPLQPVAPAGIGGITRKFDAAKHPRGEDGRFIEATQPRIFNRPSEVAQETSWGETSWRWLPTQEEIEKYGYPPGKPTGRMLTGEPIPREQLPPVLYHVTTNAPAVESSGVLLGLLESGGLGGGQAEGVSFTSSKEDARVIQRELVRAVEIAKGDVDIDVVEQWAREDEKEAGLPEGSLAYAVKQARIMWDSNIFSVKASFVSDPTGEYAEENRGKTFGYIGPQTPERQEELRRSLMKDMFNSYLNARESAAKRATGQDVSILKNPILFSDQKLLEGLNPKDVQILEVESEQIPAEALVTTGSDKFLHEVRAYSDVPYRRRKKVAFDPNQARHPEGSAEGGQFAETGRAGKPTSDPVLAVQAKAGIAAVEKLLPEAVKTANYTNVSGAWDDLNEAARERTFKHYEEKTYDYTSTHLNTHALDGLVQIEIEKKHRDEIVQEALKKTAEEFKDQVDPKSIEIDTGNLDWIGEEQIKWDALRRSDLPDKNTPVTGFLLKGVQQSFHEHYSDIWKKKVEEYMDTDEYLARREKAVLTQIREKWKALDPQRKLELATELRMIGELPGNVQDLSREPKKWVTGVEVGSHDDDNYARTHAIARKLTELRTEEIRQERGLMKLGPKPEYTIHERPAFLDRVAGFQVKDSKGQNVGFGTTMEQAQQDADAWVKEQQLANAEGLPIVTTEKLIESIWQSWKTKSSSGLGLSLQLAAAKELGGHHRMTPEEVISATQTAEEYGGIPHLQAYVRAQWEVTQMVMQKAGQEKISVYRGLMLPGDQVKATPKVYADTAGNILEPPDLPPPTNIKSKTTFQGVYVSFDSGGNHYVVEKLSPKESDEAAILRRMVFLNDSLRRQSKLLVKLPALQLQRAGAQSTTGTPEVANSWGGVGDLPPNPERVVLRIEAPATSVLSIPVYGENAQSEHETVVLGTKDKWLWDAWHEKAPTFDVQGIAQKAEMQPLVIDLQALDRGKPHWMSSVDWTQVEKREYVREPAGTAEGGQFASSAEVLQGVDTKVNAQKQTEKHLANWQELTGKRPTPEALKAAEAELRALPLVHGTTVAGALGAVDKGLLSHSDMEGQVKDLKEDIDDLKDSINNIVGEDADWGNIPFYTEDDIAGLGLDRSDAEALQGYISELQDIEKVIMGKTFDADKLLGLDQFVFMTHGAKHQDYGNVAVIVDNELIQDGWATEKDIVMVASIAPVLTPKIHEEYEPLGIAEYQRLIVKGDDYYGVAAAKAGSPEYLANRSRDQLFEVKVPAVPKKSVLGFVVEGDFEAAQRLAEGLAARKMKNKVLYIEENYGPEKRKFVQDQLKAMQASGMWDEDALDAFKEQHEGVYIL